MRFLISEGPLSCVKSCRSSYTGSSSSHPTRVVCPDLQGLGPVVQGLGQVRGRDLVGLRVDPLALAQRCQHVGRLLRQGSYLRLIEACITQLTAQGPSRTSGYSVSVASITAALLSGTFGPYVVHIWSRYPPELGGTQPS